MPEPTVDIQTPEDPHRQPADDDDSEEGEDVPPATGAGGSDDGGSGGSGADPADSGSSGLALPGSPKLWLAAGLAGGALLLYVRWLRSQPSARGTDDSPPTNATEMTAEDVAAGLDGPGTDPHAGIDTDVDDPLEIDDQLIHNTGIFPSLADDEEAS